EDKGKHCEAYGGHGQHVDEGNDRDASRAAIVEAQHDSERPSLIVVRSHIAYPAPHAQDTAKAHGSPLGEEEVRATKERLGWDPDKKFFIPEGVYEHMSQIDRGIELEQEWKNGFERWSTAFPA